MSRKAFAQNIAASLALSAWDRDTLQDCLYRHFAAALHSFVPPLVADVMIDLPMAYAPPVKQICAGLLRLDMFARLYDQSLKQAAWPNPDLLRGILAHVPVHPDSFGFVPGRNCLQGAARHVGEEALLCCDLKDFFPQIGPGRTFGLFRCLGYPETVARLLTGICTTRTPSRVLQRLDHEIRQTYRITHLPQGAPTSPAIANSACYGLDRRLSGLARSNDCNKSRYADDLCLAGARADVGRLKGVLPDIIADEGLVLHHAKTRLMHARGRQIVTGVVVNGRINISRRTYDQLRATIHHLSNPDDPRRNDRTFISSLRGRIDWVRATNNVRGAKLLDQLAAALARKS